MLALATVSLLATFVWACLLASSGPVASAAAPDSTILIEPGAIQATKIQTDTYDKDTTSSNWNNTAANATLLSGVGLTCDQAIQYQDLTFYRLDIASPGADQDWYTSDTAAANHFYTFTAQTQDPTTPLQLSLEVWDSGVANLLGNGAGKYVTVTLFTAVTTQFRLHLSLAGNITGTESMPYQISMCSSGNTVTATPTNTPTQTPTPTPTFTPSPTGGSAASDVFDQQTPNNQFPNQNRNSFINVNAVLAGMNFYNAAGGTQSPIRGDAGADVDWYLFYARAGNTYRATTVVQPGVDTEMFVFDNSITTVPVASVNASGKGLIASNDDYVALSRASQVVFTAPADGPYWIKVWNLDRTPRGSGQTYDLKLEEVGSVTGTPTQTSTPFPTGFDTCEPNGTFDQACLLVIGKEFSANFVPFQPGSNDDTDNDYYKFTTKQGLFYTCETLNLAPGVDTNIIIYNKDRVGVGGNDDISDAEKQKGNFASRFTFQSGYTGLYYVLAGEVSPPRASEATRDRSYQIKCSIGLPATVVPTAAAAGTGASPATSGQPPADAPAAFPPTPVVGTAIPINPALPPTSLSVKPIARPTSAVSVAAQKPTVVVRTVVINVQAFNDANNNGTIDPGEGMSGMSVLLFDSVTNAPIDWRLTDADGKVRLSANTDNPVVVKLPLFEYTNQVSAATATLQIALASPSSDTTIPSILP